MVSKQKVCGIYFHNEILLGDRGYLSHQDSLVLDENKKFTWVQNDFIHVIRNVRKGEWRLIGDTIFLKVHSFSSSLKCTYINKRGKQVPCKIPRELKSAIIKLMRIDEYTLMEPGNKLELEEVSNR